MAGGHGGRIQPLLKAELYRLGPKFDAEWGRGRCGHWYNKIQVIGQFSREMLPCSDARGNLAGPATPPVEGVAITDAIYVIVLSGTRSVWACNPTPSMGMRKIQPGRFEEPSHNNMRVACADVRA